jgi:8-amino-7-oxononanoate synthase
MLIAHLESRLRERAAQSLTRRRRTVEGPCAPHQRVSPPGGGETRAMLAFCSNDYLGLAGDARLAEALAEGARLHGVGSGASHLISGHHRAHEALDEALAAMLAPNVPDARALSFSTGYMANLALLTALGDAQATLFSDKLNHASIIDGARLAAAAVQRYPHGQVERLDALLSACVTPIKLIVTDAVFSMDGALAPLAELLALAERHDAWIVLDDAHGFGVLGPRGAGTLAHFGLRSERFIVMGTLGKAAGLAGAFVAAHPVVIDALVQTARSYIYTTAASPAMAHALVASLAIIEGDEGAARRAHLQALIARLRDGLSALIADHAGLGWALPPSPTAIQPLIVGSNDAALALANGLEAQGLWVPAIRPPTVPVGSARLRLTLSAAHTMGDVERLLEALRALAAAASGAASRAACEQAAATAEGTPGATTSTTGGMTDGVTA